MDRDLRTLRRSRLMNYSEFRTMTTALEKYYKDMKVAIMVGKRTERDLDMRPFLYDEGDSYDKPFYGTLLKMLYEVAISKFFDKQYEDLQKIYKWYTANKKLISSPPKVRIPSPQMEDVKSDEDSLEDEDEDEGSETGQVKGLSKVPKLHLRPKTAPSVESRRGARYVTWNEAQQQKAHKRPLSGGRNGTRRIQSPLTQSLQINGFGQEGSGVSFTELHSYRPGTAPPAFRSSKTKMSKEALKSFVLKPYHSTAVPFSSPVGSPVTTPRDSPTPTRSKSPISVHFSPSVTKEPGAKVNIKVPQQKDQSDDSNRSASNVEEHAVPEEHAGAVSSAESCTHYTLSPDAPPTAVQRILQQQRREEQLLQEQQELLQAKLLHQYDRYINDSRAAHAEPEARLQVERGLVTVSSAPALVTAYHVPEIIPSYSQVYTANHGEPLRSTTPDALKKSAPSPARHLRHHTVPLEKRLPADGLSVDAVLGMATPIGKQMEYDRERMSRQEISHPLASGRLSPATPVLPSQASRPGSVGRSPSPTPLSRPTSASSSRSEVKCREPELSPERTPRDYLVHFAQNSKLNGEKHYKTSGPVVPDTVRYQWTNDGFGGRTYVKNLKTATSPRSPRMPAKRPNQSQLAKPNPVEVTMVTGQRSLDKKTLASLMVVRQLGESDRRSSDRFAEAAPDDADANQESLQYAYQLQYLNFCQPVGPRLGECERPSTVSWYLQGEHGLYKEPTQYSDPGFAEVEDLRRGRGDIRLAKDRALMVEGRHIGAGDSAEPREPASPPLKNHVTDQQPERELTSSSSSSAEHEKEVVRSPRPTRRTPSPSCGHHTISLPSARRPPSRPCSGRSDQSAKNPPNFTVKQFNHFCWPDEMLLMEDYQRQREVWAAVNIQRIFRGFMARQYTVQLKEAERERQRRAAITLQSNFRGFMTRKLMIEEKLKAYTPSTRTVEWARQYKQDLKKREMARQQKVHHSLIRNSKEAEQQEERVKNMKAHQHIYEIYHPNPDGPTKAQKKAAAITIQRYFRGWFVRRMYKKVKEKALKRTLSFSKFTKGYQALLYRVQKRHGVKEPVTSLHFHELMEYVDRLNKYEVAFEKFAANGVVDYKDLKEFFKSVGHFPSQKEIDEAIELITKSSAKGRALTKAEAVEVLFHIYVPKGTGIKLEDVRKSTWLNPLAGGQDMMQLLSKKDIEETNLQKCLELLANSGKESEDIQELLRPSSGKKVGAKDSGKGGKKAGRKSTVLAQYPLRPPSSSGSRKKSSSTAPKTTKK